MKYQVLVTTYDRGTFFLFNEALVVRKDNHAFLLHLQRLYKSVYFVHGLIYLK